MSTATATPAYVFAYEVSHGLRNLNDRIDEEHGVIKGVKLAGFQSKNIGETIGLTAEHFGDAARRPYRYSEKPETAALYEGRKVFLNHPDFDYLPSGRRVAKNPDRHLQDSIGWIENVKHIPGDGFYGDLHYVKSHGYAPMLVETIKRNPNQLALSQVAAWKNPRLENGQIVVDIAEIRSVDLVGDEPGTTKNIFEGLAMDPMTYEQPPVETEAPADPGASLDTAIAALMADVDMETKKKVLKGLLAKMGGDAPADPPADEPKPEPAAEAKAADFSAAYESVNLLNAHGKSVTESRLRILCGMSCESDRKAYVAELPNTPAYEARSSAQQPTVKQDPPKEAKTVYKGGGDFARSLRG